jgi:hypothetical protein
MHVHGRLEQIKHIEREKGIKRYSECEWAKWSLDMKRIEKQE